MSSSGLDVVSVAGARPNFMKIAPLARAFEALPEVRHRIVHTGQHYDSNMSELFFKELCIPRPWRNLEVGSSTHAIQTAEIMKAFDEVLMDDPPDLVLVVGDVNSTIACSLVSVKRGLPVVHVEAGLRSFDRSMPEEINRVLTDTLSELLFVTEPSGVHNLEREGIPRERIFLVGNVMIDTLLAARARARHSHVLGRFGIEGKPFGVVTLHRPSNVDVGERLTGILEALGEIAGDLPLIFPLHPRTRSRLLETGRDLSGQEGVRFVEPLGYLDFLALMEGARVILTDSGGIQEEACILGVPCLTLRENTERPITLQLGLNRLVGFDPEKIKGAARELLRSDKPEVRAPDLWDGRAAQRIVDIIWRHYGQNDRKRSLTEGSR